MTMTEEKKARNFIKEAKTVDKKRLRNPDDVNTTIRLNIQLRQDIAKYCLKHDVSMNHIIVTYLKKLIDSESTT
jgi:hypothetical protein